MSLINENISLVDPKYKDEIASAILNLQEKRIDLNINSILDEMTDFIANTYTNSEKMETYKSVWINRIKSTSNLLNIKLTYANPEWDNILCRIIERKSSMPSLIDLEIKSVSTSKRTVDTTTSKSGLSIAEKSKIKEMYKALDKSKMWVLSTGRRVEEVMETFALSCNYEHLSCSLISDVEDEHWCSYFNYDELKEIKSSCLKQSHHIPEEMEVFLKSIPKTTSTEEIFEYLNKQIISAKEKRNLYWAKTSLLNAADLFNTNYFTALDLSEKDLLRRMWCFIDNVFDTSSVKFRRKNGEKKNGERPDFLFLCGRYELGCGKIEKLESNSTKGINDSSIKLPKTLKAMLLNLFDHCSNIRQELYIIGVIISGAKLSLKFMDNPGGYVCRMKQTKEYYFPKESDEFLKRMIPLVSRIWEMKLDLEWNLNMVLASDLDDMNVKIPPCFY
ncbi:uncharacterized protein BX663DRAFT_511446 [Cokeromyces recurvatus]|uniref:uncharacterized protein n=1 Tax=Cokeromyces recurvatus TaxID=90255 RepID=UPI002220CA19|nr:uncharacterized protein BX663DRAFT_511446 [Cokeromyces recurvatus]KAI7902023.1 hypothetical protein BX663DRAFT_511446 [Cokeromyces recurvatus]